MKQFLLFLLALMLLAACAPAATQSPDTPIDNETLPGTAIPITDYTPRPGDSGMVRGAVFIDSIELLTMESYPLQFSLALAGNLPTPCNQLRVAVNSPDTDKKIVVDVYSVSAPDAVCIQMLEPFSVNFPLGSFPAGHYSLWVNGEKVAEFDS